MKITKTSDGGVLTVKLEGNLDTITSPELESALDGNALDGVSALVFDFSLVPYVSSAGLRVLLQTHRRLAGEVTLTGVNEVVKDVLDMTGFTDLFKFS